MTGHALYFLLLVSFSFPVVFSKFDYFQYYYSKYHRGTSTREATSSTSGISTPEEIASSSQGFSTEETFFFKTSEPFTTLNEDTRTAKPDEDDSSSEEVSSSEDSSKTNLHANVTDVQHGNSYDDYVQYRFMARIGIIVGSVIFFVFCLGCIVCCCPSCCRGSERRGFVVRDNNAIRGTEVHPQQPVSQTLQQHVTVQHFPPEYMQEPAQQFPPQYQQQPLMPQSQYSPVQPGYPQTQYSPMQPGYQQTSPPLQFYNPPEAPPPYEATAPNKY